VTAMTKIAVVCCLVCAGAAAEFGGKNAEAAPAASKDAAVITPTVPDQYKLNMLICTTIIAVNQANKTGNYSVLRDLGAPHFQSTNSVAKLTESFSGLRNANLDLSPVLFFTPQLIREPAIDANGMLRLTGFFASQPQQVNFDLAFEFVQGEWRLFGVSVATGPAATPNVPANNPARAVPPSR
jgi:hypothetical protein